ncbi:MAG: UvrD-helicase domain-containing protein [Betaproteobacteria bacterium]|nr:UvrD-helicase domain-containing protein [Betaproteobacteria bacterium]
MDSAHFNQIALNPSHSVVVEACAGSGKTWLLVSRIVRLLLSGADPSTILAITFTHKAAGEMRTRLYDWLRFCASADEEEVRAFLHQRAIPEDEMVVQVERARNLLETVLTAQPGLRLLTFHAWFFDLIRSASLSSGLSGYTLTEHTGALRAQAWAQLVQTLERAPASTLTNDMQALLEDIGLHSTRALLHNFLQQRSDWWAYTEGQADPAAWAARQLCAQCSGNMESDIAAECLTQAGFHTQLRLYIEQLALSTERRQRLANNIADTMADVELDKPRQFERLCELILTKNKAVNGTFKPGTSPATQSLYAAHIAVSEVLVQAWQKSVDQRAYHFNLRTFRLGEALLHHYQQVKQQQRVLDFSDIEWQAARLLSNVDEADYMLHKLDARYRHVLLDEFQDTNPLQWRILQTWLNASEQSGTHPDIFLVGDPKQSIYRFRGAQAGLFQLVTDRLRNQHAQYLSQHYTRRNAMPVIDTLNACFAQLHHPLFVTHQVHDTARPGRVEVLPIVELALSAAVTVDAASSIAMASQPITGHSPCRNPLLTTPPDEEETQAHELEAAQLTRRIAQIVGHWVIEDSDTALPRPARYSDIMILVRQRTHLPTYETALKRASIPYSSNRSGGLLDTMEIGDILALLRCFIDTDDNLALARTLRSPIFNASDDDLQRIRLHQRNSGQNSWWHNLVNLMSEDSILGHAAENLQAWRTLSTQLPVHDLLDRILSDTDLPARYTANVPAVLAHSVQANLHAFIALSLSLSGGRYPSLPRFLNELEQLRAYPDEHPDEGEPLLHEEAVRIHTVHGAKGLEAPIVWLLDAGGRKTRGQHYQVLSHWPADAPRPQHFSVLGKQAMQASWQQNALEQDAQAAEIEALNLLYVAMTRARQVLLVSAANDSDHNNWHRIIRTALPESQGFVGTDFNMTVPDTWLPIRPPTQPVTIAWPTNLVPVGQRREPPDSISEFGTLVHRLLELATATDCNLSRVQGLFGAHPRWQEAWQICQRILNAPHLQHFFLPAEYRRAHNELTYVRQDGHIGRIDRVVEFEHEVWVLDYKTGTSLNAAQLLTEYREQLSEYRDAMQICYPGKTVSCALINQQAELVRMD